MSTPTLRPETQERVDRLCQAAWIGQISLEAFRGLVLATLREQDRDTRHACAEAVCAIESCGLTDVRTTVNRAHQACMNAHAI